MLRTGTTRWDWEYGWRCCWPSWSGRHRDDRRSRVIRNDPARVAAEVDDFLRERAAEIIDGQREQPPNRRDRGTDQQPVVSVSPDAEVQILGDDGEVEANTGLLLPVGDEDLLVAADGGGPRISTEAVDGTDYRIITAQLPGGGAVQVARSLEESTGLLSDLRTRILLVAGVVAVLAAALGWVVARHTTRPLEALTETVEEVAETTDLEVPVPEAGADEVGRLARAFNRMLGALKLSREQQRRLVQDAAHELRTPLTSVTANVDWLARAPDLDPDTRAPRGISPRSCASSTPSCPGSSSWPALKGGADDGSTDLSAVVRSAAEAFTLRTGRELAIDTSPAATVMGDADSLERAVGNLLNNGEVLSLRVHPSPHPGGACGRVRRGCRSGNPRGGGRPRLRALLPLGPTPLTTRFGTRVVDRGRDRAATPRRGARGGLPPGWGPRRVHPADAVMRRCAPSDPLDSRV